MCASSIIFAFVAVAAYSADAADSRRLRTNIRHRRVYGDILVEEPEHVDILMPDTSISMSVPLLEAEISLSMPAPMEEKGTKGKGSKARKPVPLLEAEMSMSMSTFMEEEGPEEKGTKARELRAEEFEIGTRRAQKTADSIKCTWDEKFDITKSHLKTCKKLKDEHTVPYTCDGQYTNVCCTVSSIVIPVFEKFGTCFKVGSATDVIDEDPEPLDEMMEGSELSMSMPIPESAHEPEPEPEEASSMHSKNETVKCTWKSTFAKLSHKKSCRKMANEYSVPYTCDGGKNVCCTESTIPNPVFDNFGKCTKV